MSDTTLQRETTYIDRDISWIYFNHRILQEAGRKEIPPIQRLAFMGIYSNNLDEFFRVRVAALSRIAAMRDSETSEESKHATKVLERISSLDKKLSSEYTAILTDLHLELSGLGIEIVDEKDLDKNQRHFARKLLRTTVAGYLSPIWLSECEGFSKESDSHIHLAAELKGPGIKTEYVILELPTKRCGRFITLPSREGRRQVMYIDDLVRLSLPMLFAGMGYTAFRAWSFKFTKDAELDIDNDMHESALGKIEKAVKSRKKGAAVRVLYDREMPADLLKKILGLLKIDALDTVKPSGRYQNHRDLMSFPDFGDVVLKPAEWPQAVPKELKEDHSILQLICEKDRCVHVPYQTFDYVVRMLQEAALSLHVKSIKITLYRLARNSKIVEALVCAARNGKRVTAVVELMARFDEESNIHYAKKMQDAGVKVVFGVEGLKVHSKIMHIGLKNGKDIALVGTGNFHEGNAGTYTDHFLMTADKRIVSEVRKIFDVIKRPFAAQTFRHLLVSPFNMREEFDKLIDAEITAAKKGRPSWIKIKLNHVTDPHMVSRLYEASQAGVKIDMLVRGNCSLVTMPGTPGEGIQIAGIIDRYLEHSRIFIFYAGGEEKTYMGSADWMPRNLDRRIEVVARIFDPEIKADLKRAVEYGLRDNVKARIVDGSGDNRIRYNPEETAPFESQKRLMEYYRSKK